MAGKKKTMKGGIPNKFDELNKLFNLITQNDPGLFTPFLI
jgi:hypothetical protein